MSPLQYVPADRVSIPPPVSVWTVKSAIIEEDGTFRKPSRDVVSRYPIELLRVNSDEWLHTGYDDEAATTTALLTDASLEVVGAFVAVARLKMTLKRQTATPCGWPLM